MHSYVIYVYYYNPLHVSSNSVLIIRSYCINTASDTVLIQFDLLMMSTVLLETCRGL